VIEHEQILDALKQREGALLREILRAPSSERLASDAAGTGGGACRAHDEACTVRARLFRGPFC
jgi:hypothetical protein